MELVGAHTLAAAHGTQHRLILADDFEFGADWKRVWRAHPNTGRRDLGHFRDGHACNRAFDYGDITDPAPGLGPPVFAPLNFVLRLHAVIVLSFFACINS